MNSKQFINHLKETKEALRGNVLTVFVENEQKHFTTLKEFGLYVLSVLKEDSYCEVLFTNHFMITDKVTEVKPMTEEEYSLCIGNAVQEFGTSA